MLWLPLFSAPITYTATRILLPAAFVGLVVVTLAGKDIGAKAAIVAWIFSCWIASFTHGRSRAAHTKPADPVQVHLFSPFGYLTALWTLGSDITLDQYVRHRDPSTGELFVLTVFRDGRRRCTCSIAHWLEAKRQMDNEPVS